MTFRWGGAQVRLSFYFFLAVALFLLWEPSGLAGLFFVGVVLHECGHLLVIALLGLPVSEVNLTPLEVGLRLEDGPRLTPGRQLLLTLAGPGANLAAAGVFALSGTMPWLQLSAINLVLGMFHLLPLSGLDGGTALSLGLVRLLGPVYGQLLCCLVQGCVGAVGLAGCVWAMGRWGVTLPLVLAAVLFTGSILSPGGD